MSVIQRTGQKQKSAFVIHCTEALRGMCYRYNVLVFYLRCKKIAKGRVIAIGLVR